MIKLIRNRSLASWLKTIFPICQWLPKYQLSDIPYDIVAGFTVGLTLLPVSLAYAQMAYLRPEYGLYSSFLGQFIYIFLGTSKDAIIGPSAIGSMLLAQFNLQNPLYMLGDNTYASLLAMTNGIILMLIGIFKLGFIVNLFSIPVVSGFTSASAFAISASQLTTLFGIQKAPNNDPPGVFVKKIKHIFDSSDEIRPLDLIVGLSSLAFLLLVEYFHIAFLKLLKRCCQPTTAKAKKFRESALNYLRLIVASRNVVVFIVTTSIAFYLYSENPNEMKDRLTVVGYIKPGFPIPRFPKLQVTNKTNVLIETKKGTFESVEQDVVVQGAKDVFSTLSVGFVIMPLMAIMELFAILKALARKNGYRIDASQELVGVGLGNFLQSFIAAYPITAATAKCALNDQCRVRSSLSTLVSIIIILVSIGCLTDVFFYVPKAALSAILIAAAHHLFDYKAAINVWREYKPDLFLFVATFLLCLFFDLAYGILIAILLNMLTFLHPVVKVQLSVTKEPLEHITHHNVTHQIGEENVTVTVIQLSHGMKYPTVDTFIDKMAHIFGTNAVHFVLDCRFVTGFDFTGLQAWHMLLRMAFDNKKHIIFTNLPEHVRYHLESIGLENFRHVSDVETAIFEFSSAIAVPDSGSVPPNIAAIRRLRQTISVVSVESSRHSNQTLPTTTAITSEAQPRAYSFTTSHPYQHYDKHSDNASSEDLQAQEARLMKLLESTVPDIYNIPMGVGGIGDDNETNETVDEEKPSSHQDIADHALYHKNHSVFGTHRMYSIEETDSLLQDSNNSEIMQKQRRRKPEYDQIVLKNAATQTSEGDPN